jgi:hypothetical protein
MQKIIEAEKSDLFDVLAHDIKRPFKSCCATISSGIGGKADANADSIRPGYGNCGKAAS